jgi:SAM-dependent methyltransferase
MTWTIENSFDRSARAVFPPSWPNEMLVKVMSSINYSNLANDLNSISKVLEVGIFSGNNSRFLIENGYEVSGSEINGEMIDLCKTNLTRLNCKIPEVRIGNNINLDFRDNEFDLIISINTIHYSSGQESMQAISEFARVVKKGRWAIIETPAKNHFAVEQSERTSELKWIWKAGGFREGETFGFFDSEDHFSSCLKKEFTEVSICYRMERYEGITLDFWMAICKK